MARLQALQVKAPALRMELQWIESDLAAALEPLTSGRRGGYDNPLASTGGVCCGCNFKDPSCKVCNGTGLIKVDWIREQAARGDKPKP